MTTVRLVMGGSLEGTLKAFKGVNPLPAILISYAYAQWFKHLDVIPHRDWALDSGAFTAANSGQPIHLEDYIKKCKELLSGPCPPVEIFSLDVISDWKGSLENTDKMTNAGVKVIPVYHIGEPAHVLKSMAKQYDKIALGGVASLRKRKMKEQWILKCFETVWPKKIHGLAITSKRMLLLAPWDSVDSTSWKIGPERYGRWLQYRSHMPGVSVRKDTGISLRGEVEQYLQLEKLCQHRWKNELKELN